MVNSGRARTVSAVMVVAAALLLSACGSGAGAGTATADAGTPKSGGTVTVGVQTLNNADPQIAGNNDQIALARQTVASLTIADPESGEILPWVSESYSVNDDATSFTFHLRPDAKFWDGTPIDAEAVKANFDSLLALGAQASKASGYLKGAQTSVVDDKTVTVAFTNPNAQFLEATSTFTLGLISTESTKRSLADRAQGKFVGSGPFKVESFSENDEAVLTKTPGYNLGTSANSHQTEAYLDKIVFKALPEEGVRAGSLRAGSVDVATFLTTSDLKTFESGGYSVIRRPNPGVVYQLTPYLERPLTQDVRVRQAIQKAIDRPAITRVFYGGTAEPPSSLLADTTPLTTDLSPLLNRDVDGANALLDQAGWVRSGDGVREKDGKRLELSLVFYQEQDPLLLVQQELREIGIDLKIKQVPIGELTGARDSGRYDFSYGNTTRNEPDQLRNSYQNEFAKIIGLALDSTAQTPDTDQIADLLERQAGVLDVTERTRLIEQAQTLILQGGYAIPVYQLVTGIALSDKVKGLEFESSSRLDFYDTWITS